MTARPPPLELWNWLGPVGPGFVHRVEALLTWVGRGRIGVNSWWRDPITNERVGGDPWSQHLYATAADLQTGDLTSTVLAVAPYFGLIATTISRTAVHVQLYPAGMLERLGVRPPGLAL